METGQQKFVVPFALYFNLAYCCFYILLFYSCVVLWEFVNVFIQSSVTLLAATNSPSPLVLFLFFSHLPLYMLFCSKLNPWNRSPASLHCDKMTNQFPITVQKKAKKSSWQNGLTSKLVPRVSSWFLGTRLPNHSLFIESLMLAPANSLEKQN